MEFNSFQTFFKNVTQTTGALINRAFLDPMLQVESKSDASPVTQIDRDCETFIRDAIVKAYPKHGIIGEEFDSLNPDAEFVWVIDPIDGTKSFITGVPLFGTMVCLMRDKKPLYSGIHLPPLHVTVFGDGQQATFNDRIIHVRPPRPLSESIILTTSMDDIEIHQDISHFNKLAKQCRFLRTWGDCYGYILVAGGWADVMCDPILNQWDLLPLIPIIKGAGGTISGWNGEDALKTESAVAAHPETHTEIINALAGRY